MNKKAIVTPVITCIVLSGIIIYLFSNIGLVFNYTSLNLSYLVFPLVGYCLIRLVAKLTRSFLKGLSSRYGYIILSGLAAAFISYMLLNILPSTSDLFNYLSELSGLNFFSFISYLPLLANLKFYLVMIVAGVIILKLASPLEEYPKGSVYYPALTAIGVLVVGYGIMSTLKPLSALWMPIDMVGAIIFVGFIAVTVAVIGLYGQSSRNQLISDACNWLGRSQARNFTLGTLFGIYLLTIRPWIMVTFSYALLIEWGVVCFIVWMMYSGVKFKIKHFSGDFRFSPWEKHIQKVERKIDEDFIHLNTIQRDFLEYGIKNDLLVYAVKILHDNNIDSNKISHILDPLIKYQDTKVPRFVFGWEQKRVARRNKENRKKILDNFIQILKEENKQDSLDASAPVDFYLKTSIRKTYL